MTKRKYRIVETIYDHDEVINSFTPQVKILFWWQNMIPSDYYSQNFRSREEARDYIDKSVAIRNRKRRIENINGENK